jgi:DNA (cytosine-5)-methyltransferase 1
VTYDLDSETYEVEGSNTVILGEDRDEDEGSRPVRLLTDFLIFEPGNDNELVSLDELLNATSSRQFEAVGDVAPVYANEEDAGLDDDMEDVPRQRLRTTAIFSFTMDYKSNE